MESSVFGEVGQSDRDDPSSSNDEENLPQVSEKSYGDVFVSTPFITKLQNCNLCNFKPCSFSKKISDARCKIHKDAW